MSDSSSTKWRNFRGIMEGINIILAVVKLETAFNPQVLANTIDHCCTEFHGFETEASGGINLDNILDYAETGVDYVSVGALIHQARSLDLSLKAVS